MLASRPMMATTIMISTSVKPVFRTRRICMVGLSHPPSPGLERCKEQITGIQYVSIFSQHEETQVTIPIDTEEPFGFRDLMPFFMLVEKKPKLLAWASLIEDRLEACDREGGSLASQGSTSSGGDQVGNGVERVGFLNHRCHRVVLEVVGDE